MNTLSIQNTVKLDTTLVIPPPNRYIIYNTATNHFCNEHARCSTMFATESTSENAPHEMEEISHRRTQITHCWGSRQIHPIVVGGVDLLADASISLEQPTTSSTTTLCAPCGLFVFCSRAHMDNVFAYWQISPSELLIIKWSMQFEYTHVCNYYCGGFPCAGSTGWNICAGCETLPSDT